MAPENLTNELIRSGKLTEQDLALAKQALRTDESLLNALIRTGAIAFSDLVLARFGAQGLPIVNERPFSKRLGMRLVAERAITQFQLKQALIAQADRHRPIGRVLMEDMGVSPAAIQKATVGHQPLAPVLPEADKLGSLLIRWGLLDQAQWTRVLAAGPRPTETLLKRRLCNEDHLRRVLSFQRGKVAALAERRHRIGEVLVSMEALDCEMLAKMLACQVDQPFSFGELLVMQRVCSPEVVLEALFEQQRRYDAAVEAALPPVLPMVDPKPVSDAPVPAPHVDRRKQWAIALGVLAILGYATWYGLRYGARNYKWLALFRRSDPVSSPLRHRPPGDVLGGSDQKSESPPPGTLFDGLSLPPGHPDLGEANQTMESRSGIKYEPFAQDGPPQTPNTNVQTGELSRERGMSPSFTPEPDQKPAHSGVSYPMQRQEGLSQTRYPMAGQTTPTSQQEAMREPDGPPSLTGRQLPEDKPPDASFPDAMRAPEGPRSLTKPAAVPPPPSYARRPMSAAESLQDRTVNRSSSMFRYRLGQAYFAQDQPDSARQEFLSALAADPANPHPLYYLGRLSEGKNPQEARRYYEQYLRQAPHGEFEEDVAGRLQRLRR